MKNKSIFRDALNQLNDLVYKNNNLILDSVEEENQNAAYGGGRFKLSSKSVRFRVAKLTPKKSGEFVVFWEKDSSNKNQAYHYDEAPDLLVVNCKGINHEFGQFVFPKQVLLEHKVLRTDFSKGKMGMRVYPIWDYPESKEALRTQNWQKDYFIDFSKKENFPKGEILNLYNQKII